jgi:CubicO group peptidase (beta-lactamase class C family)
MASPRDAEAFARDPLLKSVWGNPVIFDRDTFFWNERRVHAAEMPGANGIGTMRSIARIYGSLVAGGGPLLTEETLRLGLTPLSTGYDALNDLTRSFGVGFQLPSESNYFGPAAEGFGHGGAGGSHHGAWPSLGIGYSYAMNQMRDGARPDPRAKALLDALHACAMDAGGS